MSNPTGTPDTGDGAEDASAGDGLAGAAADSWAVNEPVTEEISIASIGDPAPGEASGDDAPGEPSDDDGPVARRYTAPGFDAGSTQIIDRIPDPPTEFISAAAPTATAVSDPELPARSRPRWRSPVALLIGGLLAVIVLGGAALWYVSSTRVSQEERVRQTIQAFDAAVQQGDLATLRSVTCGQTRDNYASYDDETWTSTYAKVLAAKQYPVVASIDDVVVNGDHAEANVTSYMAFDPDTRATRSFDLQFRDEQWKICQSS